MERTKGGVPMQVNRTRTAVLVMDYQLEVVSRQAEGPLLRWSNLIDCKPEDVRIGMPVEVVFEDVSPEVTLPKFRPAKVG